MKTIEEAKGMICPQTWQWVDHRHPGGQGFASVHCSADRCMAWRWEVAGRKLPPGGDYPRGCPVDVRTGRGYCGLVGEPSRYDFAEDEIEVTECR